MNPVEIFPRVHQLSIGPVNVLYVLDDDGVTLVDTGYHGQEAAILDGLTALGKGPADVKRLLLTHCHPDHAGGLAALKAASKAPAWMHPLDAEVVRGNAPMRKGACSPGLLNRVLYTVFIKNAKPDVPPATVEHEIGEGDVLPISGGIEVLHTPGHCAGHVSYLLQRDGGLLVAGDVCSNMPALGFSVVYDDIDEARRTLKRLCGIKVKAMAFGHGKAITDGASHRFAARWAAIR